MSRPSPRLPSTDCHRNPAPSPSPRRAGSGCTTRPSRVRLLSAGLLLLASFCAGVVAAAEEGAPRSEAVATGLHTTDAGHVFQVRKERVDGRDVKTFFGQGRVLTEEQMRAFEAENPPPRVDPDLLDRAAVAPAGTMLDLVIHHVHRPGPRVARDVRVAFEDRLEPLAAEARRIRESKRPREILDERQEREWIRARHFELNPAERERVRELAEEHERVSGEMKARIEQERDLLQEGDQRAMRELVDRLGGTVVGALGLTNSLAVRMPAESLRHLAAEPSLARVRESNPEAPMLDNHDDSTGVRSSFWNHGYTGGGTWDVAILDTGVQQDHPALAPNSWVSNAGTTDSDGHGTGVAGIVFSSDSTYRGMAWDIDEAYVDVNGPNEGTARVAADWLVSGGNDPEVLNHSFGRTAASTEDYSDNEKFWDAFVDVNWVTVTQSAGNSGCCTTTIRDPSSAYNLITVANMWDQNTVARSDDVLSTSSSRGPTVGGRKKPDMAAPGQATHSTSSDWNDTCVLFPGDCPDFEDIGGTSAAAPHVAGIATLITDVRGDDDPLPIKAVLLNTADAWTDDGTTSDTSDDGRVEGSEWNKTYGWGYLDAYEAYFNATDVLEGTIGDDDRTDRNLYYTGYLLCRPSDCPNCAADKATLTWHRHASYNGSTPPDTIAWLTDLDLLLYDVEGNLLRSSVSSGDNVEQVDCTGTATHDLTPVFLRVKTYGSIDPTIGEDERFALATEEGFVPFDPPELEQTVPAQTYPYPPGLDYEFAVDVHNPGDLMALGATADLNPGGGTIVAGADPQPLGDLFGGSTQSASWTIEMPCTLDHQTLTVASKSNSWGENWGAVEEYTVIPGTWPLGLDVTIPHIPMTFDVAVPADSWVAVGISSTVDHDIALDDDFCMRSPELTSNAGGTVRDFVVVDGHTTGATTRYAMAYYGDDVTYRMKRAVANHRSLPAEGGTPIGPMTLVEDEPLEAVQLENAVAGATYRVTAERTTGTGDVDLRIFAPGPGVAKRGQENWITGGVSGDLVIDFTAPVDGAYLVVLTNEAGNRTGFRVGSECLSGCSQDPNLIFGDGFESGDLSSWAGSR